MEDGRAGLQIEAEEIVGRSPRLLAALEVARRAAEDGSCTVLLSGETGTGKELVAHAIHRGSPRNAAPFVAVNCATLAPNLADSILFGHQRGAYTDATTATRGLFVEANGGTVFLDEVQELDLRVQAKFLRFLQDRRAVAVGGEGGGRVVDVRIFAGGNCELSTAVEAGAFRSDLYYRLNVLPIHLPPLRERVEDIPLLVSHFLVELNREKGGAVTIDPRALANLSRYSWPGNVRELRNLIERLVILCQGSTIHLEDLPMPFFPEVCPGTCGVVCEETNFKQARAVALANFEQDFISRHWRLHGYQIAKTAAAIGVSREWLGRRIRRYGLCKGGGEGGGDGGGSPSSVVVPASGG